MEANLVTHYTGLWMECSRRISSQECPIKSIVQFVIFVASYSSPHIHVHASTLHIVYIVYTSLLSLHPPPSFLFSSDIYPARRGRDHISELQKEKIESTNCADNRRWEWIPLALISSHLSLPPFPFSCNLVNMYVNVEVGRFVVLWCHEWTKN